MRNLNFRYIRGENIFCFGPDGIEIRLDEIGNVIFIRGENLDVKKDEEEDKVSSNGSGKSSIPEILVYCLFGKTIKKKLKIDEPINNKIGKKLYTEVIWDKYRVVRQRKPNKLRVWESEEHEWNDDTEITRGTMPATQELIEEILGLTWQTFVNIVVFADNNSDSFLECDTDGKRRIVENLLNLEQYRRYFDVAKQERTKIKNRVKIVESECTYAKVELEAAQNRVRELYNKEVSWKEEQAKTQARLQQQIDLKQKALATTDTGVALTQYHLAQDQIKELEERLPELQEKETKIQSVIPNGKAVLDKAHNERHEINIAISEHESAIRASQNEIKAKQKFIESLQKKTGTVCDNCFGVVDEKNFLNATTKAKNVMDHHMGAIKKETDLLGIKKKELDEKDAAIAKTEALVTKAERALQGHQNMMDQIRKEIAKQMKIQKPDASSDEKVLAAEIEQIKGQLAKAKKTAEGPSPYVELSISAGKEVKEKTKAYKEKTGELDAIQAQLPYYEFWVEGFGSKGIPKFAINGIVPALNSSVNYFLQFLIDGKIKLTFNGELEELIERNPADGDPFIYNAMSGGERRRLNLAVSQAFAHIMSLSSDTCPSLVFLDEVTTNIDPTGVVGVYQMITELSKEKQVFITTHDHDLIEMLTGCETIHLRKEDGMTVAV